MRQATIALAGTLAAWSCGGDGNLGPRPSQLAFVVQPSTTVSDQILTPPIQVAIEDASGAIFSAAHDAVSLRLVGPPTGPNLSGTLKVNAIEGIATFSDLRVSVPGSGYLIQAGAEGFLEVPSVPFEGAPHPPIEHGVGQSLWP